MISITNLEAAHIAQKIQEKSSKDIAVHIGFNLSDCGFPWEIHIFKLTEPSEKSNSNVRELELIGKFNHLSDDLNELIFVSENGYVTNKTEENNYDKSTKNYR